MMFRLDSVSPVLADAFRAATPEQRRNATLIACTLVVARTHLEGEVVAVVLEHLRHGEKVGSDLLEKLRRLASRLDAEYLRMNEEEEQERREEMLGLFSKARAAACLAFALSDDSGQLHEAIYEALVAVDDSSMVVKPVAEALRR